MSTNAMIGMPKRSKMRDKIVSTVELKFFGPLVNMIHAFLI